MLLDVGRGLHSDLPTARFVAVCGSRRGAQIPIAPRSIRLCISCCSLNEMCAASRQAHVSGDKLNGRSWGIMR